MMTLPISLNNGRTKALDSCTALFMALIPVFILFRMLHSCGQKSRKSVQEKCAEPGLRKEGGRGGRVFRCFEQSGDGLTLTAVRAVRIAPNRVLGAGADPLVPGGALDEA